MGVEHALIVTEAMTAKSLEWGLDLWMANLDVRKAFDKIEHESVPYVRKDFQNIYIDLLWVLYRNQSGVVEGNEPFNIFQHSTWDQTG